MQDGIFWNYGRGCEVTIGDCGQSPERADYEDKYIKFIPNGPRAKTQEEAFVGGSGEIM